MSYVPARSDEKPEDEAQDAPTPSWFSNSADADRVESLVQRYRDRALQFEEVRRAEDEQINAFNLRLEEKLRQTRSAPAPVADEPLMAPRRVRAAILPQDENFEGASPRLARRYRKRKPTWPRYLAFGVAAMVLGGSLGYGLAKKDAIVAFFGSGGESAKTNLTSLAQPLDSAPAVAPGNANATAQPTVVPAVMTTQQQPAQPVAATSAAAPAVNTLPDPVAPGDDLVAKADGLMAQGDVASARQLYLQADAVGNAKGTYGVARTYDPKVFAAMKITGLQPDTAKAQEWYGKAAASGLTAAP